VRIAAENDGTAVPAEDRAAAVLPYSVAQWVAQANGASPDLRAEVLVGALDDNGAGGGEEDP
jgi:phosphate transport system substrate-binding protein